MKYQIPRLKSLDTEISVNALNLEWKYHAYNPDSGTFYEQLLGLVEEFENQEACVGKVN